MNDVTRNQTIGMVLLFVLLLVYLFYYSPTASTNAEEGQSVQKQDATRATFPADEADKQVPKPVIADSSLRSTYGVFFPLIRAEKKPKQALMIETEELELHFTSQGGQLQALRLKHYQTHDKQPLWLMDTVKSNLLSSFFYQGRRIELATLHLQSTLRQSRYQLSSTDTLQLCFTGELADGNTLQACYTIPGTGYQIAYTLKGLAPYASDGQLHVDWQQRVYAMEKDVISLRQNTVLTYYLSEEGLEELDVIGAGAKQEVTLDGKDLEFLAIKEKFFLLALLPAENRIVGGTLSLQDMPPSSPFVKEAVLHLQLPARDATNPPSYHVYVGPNEQRVLATVSPHASKNVYLGWGMLSWINRMFFAPLLYKLLDITQNYGLIIVVIVVVIRLILFPLTYRSYMSMAKMRMLKPEIDEIKAQHANDAKKQQSETMRLYQLAGINPLSGCIPLILQMPVLFSMFYFFPNMIDFRQAGFLWSDDLSVYDSILELPFTVPMYGDHVSLFTLLMTASTVLYTMVTSQVSTTPPQMKVIQYVMPLVFLLFLNSYSAGLTFYYFISNLISVAQQMLTKSFVRDDKIRTRLEENKQKNKQKKPSSFQKRLEEAMKEQTAKKARVSNKKKNK